MNKLIKKVLVGITAATMMFGSVCTAYAATDSATVAPAPEKQTNVKVSTAANGTATVKALPKTTKKSVTVASKVVVDGVSYKVTVIGAKAFANATKATTVTLPASIKTIGAQAFTGAKSVKTIVIKSASVKVAKTAFKGVNTKKMTIKVSGMSAKQLKAFKAQLKKAGFKGTVKKVSK